MLCTSSSLVTFNVDIYAHGILFTHIILMYIRGRESMSKVGAGARSVHEVGLFIIIYIHSEYIRHRLLVFNSFFMATSNLGGGGAQPPLIKK